MSADNGGPAFPLATGWVEDWQDDSPKKIVMVRELDHGMSLREYLAANAPDEPDWFGHYLAGNATYVDTITQLAMWRFYYADAMLKERAK